MLRQSRQIQLEKQQQPKHPFNAAADAEFDDIDASSEPKPTGSIAHLLVARPHLVLAALLGFSVILGVAVPALNEATFARDLVEQFLWGRSFELGYHKHPPLVAWLLGSLERAVPDNWRWLAFVLAQASVVIAIVCTWRLSCAIAGETVGALAACLTLVGVNYYTSPTHTFTQDTVSLALWAMSLLFYWRAVAEGRPGYWYALALTAAMFVYAKYVGALLFLILAVFTLATREGRAALVGRHEPWFAVLLVVVLSAPHLWWLYNAQVSPLTYPFDRQPAANTFETLLLPAKFLVAQAMNHIGLFVLLALMTLPLRSSRGAEIVISRAPLTPFARSFVLTVTLAPLAIVLILNLLTAVEFRHAWGAPLFPLSALGLLLLIGLDIPLRRLVVVAAIAVALVAGQHVVASIGPSFLSKPASSTYPAQEVADELTRRFKDRIGSRLRVVVGERWHAGNVAFYSRERPLLYIDGDPKLAPWVSPELIRNSGALIVWSAGEGRRMPATGGVYAGVEAQGRLSRTWPANGGRRTLNLDYLIIPPGRDPPW